MKTTRFLLAMAICLISIALSSCKPEIEPTPEPDEEKESFTLSQTKFNVDAAGTTVSVEIKSNV